jgi:hypothetical protein
LKNCKSSDKNVTTIILDILLNPSQTKTKCEINKIVFWKKKICFAFDKNVIIFWPNKPKIEQDKQIVISW